MAYSTRITRGYPTCFVFLVDQSGSMGDPYGSGEVKVKKSEGLADAINRLLQNLCLSCAREEGVRDYFHIGVIGYGAVVGPAFGGNLAGRELVPLSEIASNPMRVENRTKKVSDGAGGLVDQSVKFPVWFDAQANGGTPMYRALEEARRIVKNWVDQHPENFPPIVIHITDGEADENTDPAAAATALKSIASSDGAVLLFNLHLSSNQAAQVLFPTDETGLPDQYAHLLFSMSSQLPSTLVKNALDVGVSVKEGARGFGFNADLVSTIKFLNVGTQVASNLR